MIQNDRELEVTRQRIEQFQNWLGQMRQNAEPRNFEAMASGYRLEIERMQAEVMEYLLSPAGPALEGQVVQEVTEPVTSPD
jgi:hypothetical protein